METQSWALRYTKHTTMALSIRSKVLFMFAHCSATFMEHQGKPPSLPLIANGGFKDEVQF
jgi:hypothetical protein